MCVLHFVIHECSYCDDGKLDYRNILEPLIALLNLEQDIIHSLASDKSSYGTMLAHISLLAN